METIKELLEKKDKTIMDYARITLALDQKGAVLTFRDEKAD